MMSAEHSRLRTATWFGQPRGLAILFMTEMWEIFSYYGMRSILVYYMTQQLAFRQQSASLIYGAYTASAYFTPIIGGLVADRWLGKSRAVLIGGSIMALGHFMMAFPALLGWALATIALGNGLFLPSLPSQINDLYVADDPRRGRAYNIYYVGINLGGLLAPLVCGTLGELYGWQTGFMAAGIGMLLGLLIYAAGRRYLPAPIHPPPGGASSVPAAPSPRREQPLWLLLLAIGAAVTIFRGAYEQMGNTVALWTETGIDRHLLSLTIPKTWFQSLNPLGVFVMTPLLLARWRRQAREGREASANRKMTVGALIVAGAYALLAVVALEAGTHRASGLWLVLFYGIFTLGELHILPTGLGLFARLAPPRLAATTVASWFLAIFTGSLTAGLVGTLWSRWPPEGFFSLMALLALTAAALLHALARRTDRAEAEHARTVTRTDPAPGSGW